MALDFPFAPGQTDAKEPIDEQLMDVQIRQNLEGLDTRVTVLEGGGGGGGGGGGIADKFAQGNVVDNVGYVWKRRFHINNSHAGKVYNGNIIDLESDDHEKRVINTSKDGFYNVSDTTQYLGYRTFFSKGEFFEFKVKEGENFFSIVFLTFTSTSDNVEVYIDGVLAAGFTDINGQTTTGTFNSKATFIVDQDAAYFFGLDGKEHTVKVVNNDSGAGEFQLSGLEFGYRSRTSTLSNKVTIESGRALVNGSGASYSREEVEFTEGQNGLSNGHTGTVAINSNGVLRAIDGLSPAMTVAKPNETIAFSGAVTSVKVQNSYAFPANGICLYTTPSGYKSFMSYTSKTETDPANHTFNDVIWSNQPNEDFTPYNNIFDSNDSDFGTFDTFEGDIVFNNWAEPTLIINSGNNKLDISVTVNGVTTSHTATVPSGAYAADLVKIQLAVVDALNTAKPLNGNWICEFDENSKRYTIGADDAEVSELQLLFGTGPNSASSIGADLGFTGNQSGSKSYTATSDKNHIAPRVMFTDDSFDSPQGVNFTYTSSVTGYSTSINSDLEKLGIYDFALLSNGNHPYINYYPDEHANGAHFFFISTSRSSGFPMVQIGEGADFFPLDLNNSVPFNAGATDVNPKVKSFFISFPKGSKSIRMYWANASCYKNNGTAFNVVFLGAKPYFSKPKIEALTDSENILKTYEIAPKSVYKTYYSGTQGGILYSPQASNDNIDLITENGAWSTEAGAPIAWNGGYRTTATKNDFVDWKFTLTGDGGGFGFVAPRFAASAAGFNVFLTNTASITEATDLVCAGSFTSIAAGGDAYGKEWCGITGLPAGTYIARLKLSGQSGGAIRFRYSAFFTIDSDLPEENNYTVNDVTNTGQSTTFPVHFFRQGMRLDAAKDTPGYLSRTGFRFGKTNNIVQRIDDPVYEDFTQHPRNLEMYKNHKAHRVSSSSSNNPYELIFFGFFKTVASWDNTSTSYSVTVKPFIDNVQTPTTYQQSVMVKGGTAGSTYAHCIPLSVKKFDLNCSFSAGSTILISDTRGLRDGQEVRLFDGTNYEEFTITNIVNDTSFDIKQTPSVITIANVERVYFGGFHYFKSQKTTSGSMYVNAYMYEPLTIYPSLVKRRLTVNTREEKAVVIHKDLTGDNFYFPVHSDGVVGTMETSTFEVMKSSAGWSFRDLKNITGTVDLKVTSTRDIAIDTEDEWL